jgi:hypothetical protein
MSGPALDDVVRLALETLYRSIPLAEPALSHLRHHLGEYLQACGSKEAAAVVKPKPLSPREAQILSMIAQPRSGSAIFLAAGQEDRVLAIGGCLRSMLPDSCRSTPLGFFSSEARALRQLRIVQQSLETALIALGDFQRNQLA